MKNILVTGGAGFVGSHLAIGFKAAYPDARVVALDNLKRRGSELLLNRLRGHGVEFLHGDIRQPDDLEAAGAVDLLLECSAEPSVLAGYGGSPRYVIDTNLSGTVNCLELARTRGADVVFLSTSRVYPIAAISELRLRETDTRFELEAEQPVSGVSAAGISEAFPLEGTRSLYGATKLCSEHLFAEYQAMYGLRGVTNRCGVLTGPWQMGKADQGVVVLWAARHHYGGALKYIGYGGTGKQVRDILHIDDLLALLLTQVQHLDKHTGKIYNVGGGRDVSVSLQELTALCQAATGKRIDIAGEPENRTADVPIYITDNARVTAATGWKPERAPEQVLDDIARWIRDHEDALRPVLT
ncbi:MAG: NAD-dependent epimerase/dehydratase family protein [Candidatus Hydrogenedens sp.]|nr:NAD-dependent epimerase/dehydratase family protein [Candidatus Hydrogenedens sp.]